MIELLVNGKRHELDVDPDMPLLWALRDIIGLTGTKFGCGKAQCGACTVHVDGEPIRSCSIPVSGVADRLVTTIEGLDSVAGTALKKAWIDGQVPQCGFCQSGQLMTAAWLLEQNSNPDDAAIDQAMEGNICRCTTYNRIRVGIKSAAENLRATGANDA